MSRPTSVEAPGANSRPANRANTYSGDQVSYFGRIMRAGRPILPFGYPVRAQYLSQQGSTRVEFSPVPSTSRPLLAKGQWNDGVFR